MLSAAGDRDLVHEVNWRVMPGQRWGLVGANGAGKVSTCELVKQERLDHACTILSHSAAFQSTLLKALCGLRRVDGGKVCIAPKVEVGYLAQTAVSGSTRTVWEEAKSHMTRLLRAEADIEEAEAALAAGMSCS